MKKKILALALCAAVGGASLALAGCADGHSHDFENFYKPATCNDMGYTLHRCKECDYVFADDFVAPYGHAYEYCLSFAVPVEEAQAVAYAEGREAGDGFIQLGDLPLSKLIGDSLCAVPSAATELQQATEKYLSEVLKMQQYAEGQQKTQTIVFKKSECSFCGDCDVTAHSVEIPIMSLVPIPAFKMDEATVKFSMDVTPDEGSSPAFAGDGHDHCFDSWVMPSATPKKNSDDVASVPTKYSVGSNGELLISVTVGGSDASLAAGAQPDKVAQMNVSDHVEEIDENAFSAYSALRRAELPDGLKKVGANAFGAAKFDYLVIPKSLKSIGANAFGDCSQMKSVFYFGTEEEWNEITFGNVSDPIKSVARYYYSAEKPTASGNFWRFVNGQPARW